MSQPVPCNNLSAGQYWCSPMFTYTTGTTRYCPSETSTNANLSCYLAPNVSCADSVLVSCAAAPLSCPFETDQIAVFNRSFAGCQPVGVGRHSYGLALLLSVFFGIFGIDRMYLGYPAIGLLKLSTTGLLFIGAFVDIVLIGLQVVTPSDGLGYSGGFFGTVLFRLVLNNQTFYDDPESWFSVIDEIFHGS